MATTAAAIFGNHFARVIQCFAQKKIRVALVPWVTGTNLVQSFFETDFLHVIVLLVQ